MAVNVPTDQYAIPNYTTSRPTYTAGVPTSPTPTPTSSPTQNVSVAPTQSDPYAGLTDAQRQVLTQQFDAYNATPQSLIDRYSAIYSGPQAYQNQVQDLFGDQDRLDYTQYTTMAQLLGRAPSADEYAQLAPAFQGPNGIVNGRAAVTQYAQQVKSDPSNPNSPLNPSNPGYADSVSKYSDPIAQQYQSLLGRAPTADELSHFGGLLASGGLDAYGLGSYLKTQPEYQNAQDATFRQGLDQELQGYDTSEFNREKNDVYADYASRGFAPGTSPSLDYALTDLMGQLAKNRQSYLTQLSAQQYGGNKNLAIGGYQSTLDQQYANSNANRARNQSMLDYYQQRGDTGADYMTQQNDYLSFLNKQRSGQNTLHTGDYINLGLQAANAAGKAYSGYAYLNG